MARKIPWRVAILGCGGIGYHIGEAVGRVLAGLSPSPDLFLVDGDVIEDRNCERQFHKGVVGMTKAKALTELIAAKFPNRPRIHPVEEYLNKDTLKIHQGLWLSNPVLILAGVDNNPTRCFLEDEILKLKDVILISGGNDVYQGQVHVFARKNRKNLTPTPSQIAPEMRFDKGAPPGTDGQCLEQGAVEPQTALVNRAVSVLMEMALQDFIGEDKTIEFPKKITFNEIKVDTKEKKVAGYWRDPVPGTEDKK